VQQKIFSPACICESVSSNEDQCVFFIFFSDSHTFVDCLDLLRTRPSILDEPSISTLSTLSSSALAGCILLSGVVESFSRSGRDAKFVANFSDNRGLQLFSQSTASIQSCRSYKLTNLASSG
jgi:hypothetical protein